METKLPDKIKTGIPGLDRMLEGGFIQGRCILLSGPAGTGKSTLAMQYAYNGAIKYDEPALYVTLEENQDNINANMSQFGFDITKAKKSDKFEIIGGPIAQLKRGMYFSNASFKHILQEIIEVVKEKKIKRVVIDSINLLMMLMKNEEEKRIGLANLCGQLTKLGCTTLLISETKEGTMELSRYGIEEFVVDGIVALYLIRQGSRFIPGVAIRKMRGTNHDKEIKFVSISNKGIEVHPEETVFTNV